MEALTVQRVRRLSLTSRGCSDGLRSKPRPWTVGHGAVQGKPEDGNVKRRALFVQAARPVQASKGGKACVG